MIPTRRAAIGAAVLAIAALAVPWPIIQASATLLVIALAVDAVYARRTTNVTRTAPSVLILGAPSPLTIRHDVAAGNGRVRLRQPQTADVRVTQGEADDRLDTTITALRRGRHQLPGTAARRTGPLGLARWDFAGAEDAMITVYPDVPSARRIAHAVRTKSFRDVGELRRGPLGLGTEFESIREYQSDDDVRQVNWNATVRVGRPMSNQFRVETEREVLCLIDCGRLMGAPIGDRTRLDIAVDAVAAVAHVADVLNDRCGAIAFDQHIIRHLGHRRRGADAVVHAIHDLEPSNSDSDYDLAFRTMRNSKRALVIVCTDLVDTAAARVLLDAIPILARRHAVIVATVRDPEIHKALTDTPTSTDALYRSTVALDLDAARTEVVRALRSSGTTVVEAPAEHFSESLVSAYLGLKDSARI